VLNHRSFIDFYEWAIDTFEFNKDMNIGSLSPSFFDIYSFELCLLIQRGNCIVIIPDQYSAFPMKIIEFLVSKRINYIFWVPTIMVNIANMDILSKFELPDLKLIWFAGEVFPTRHLNYWRRCIPDARFVNMYGPIEITLDCVFYIVNKELKDDEPIPIGKPCLNTDILIIKEDDTLAKTNQIGELCVRGSSLALGYYNDLERTNLVFVQNPVNPHYPELIYRTGDLVYLNDVNNIMFMGRKDFQIKHLGYRIELSEIENAIFALDLVDNACVIYNNEKKEIVLFYESESVIEIKQIRNKLIDLIPKYMIPSKYIRIDEMPMNPNGKIDRQRLLHELQEP
jgi:acyl-coenzyme A synthetase/AMP-(fatty) acid ligase